MLNKPRDSYTRLEILTRNVLHANSWPLPLTTPQIITEHYTMRKWNDPDITLCNNETGASLCHLIMCLVSRAVSRVMLQITKCQVPTPASINDFLNQTLIGDSNCEKNTKYFHSYLFRTSDSQKLTDVVNQGLTLIYHHTK